MKRHPLSDLDATTAGMPAIETGTDVAAWRFRRLVEAGFGRGLALDLADTPGVDLHALLDLVDRGCPPALAARILSPVDSGEEWP